MWLINLIDFILNLAGLTLWFGWLAHRFDPLARASAATLIGTLKAAQPGRSRRWLFLVALAALLFIRAVVYWEIGPAMSWTPSLQLGSVALVFRSDFFRRILLFSGLSFLVGLTVFYLWVLFLSAINKNIPDADPIQKLVRLHLGRFERWPGALKFLSPFLLGGLLWMAVHPLLVRLSITPVSRDFTQLLEQAAIVGLGAYLCWKYLLAGLLLLHLLSSYVYLGGNPFWNFIDQTAKNLLRPLAWLPLRAAKVDFTPVIVMAVIFLIARFAPDLLTRAYIQVSH